MESIAHVEKGWEGCSVPLRNTYRTSQAAFLENALFPANILAENALGVGLSWKHVRREKIQKLAVGVILRQLDLMKYHHTPRLHASKLDLRWL